MAAPSGSIHDRYSTFLKDLAQSTTRDGVTDAFFRVAKSLDATAAALIEAKPCANPCGAICRRPNLVAADGSAAFWADYLALCQSGGDLVTRTLHISPHSLALRDLKSHPRLAKRITALEDVLWRHSLNDLFAVPSLGRAAPQTFAVLAGRNFDLRRSKRHLASRMTMDILARLEELTRPSAASRNDQPEKLTRRQLEIAHWLVAGKTDWEIGEILQISPKTVNYHVENMKRAYGVHSRSQFIAAIVHQGAIEPPVPPAPAPSPVDAAPRQRPRPMV